ncbi:MAG: uptake transporter, permease protein [Chloroflexi bacterium]|nr:uptake transporter, permease protein [Chloroflexota bacterium]
MTNDLISVAVLVGIITSGIRLATPYLYASIGEMFGQLSGIYNLGVDGIMLLGAFFGFYLTYQTGNPWLGLLAAVLVGGLMGLAMAFISVTMKAEQGISGIGLYLFGLGVSDLLFEQTLGSIKTVSGFQPVHIPVLSDLPIIGPIFFSQNILVYGAFALVPISWFILNKTTWGLKLKSVGQNPAAADAMGVSVSTVRYIAEIVGGILAGVAGASLSIALLNVFQQNLTFGMGFIAVALVYFGGWAPGGILVGSLLFSLVNAFQLWIQVKGVAISPDFANMLPYILTILALIFAVRKVNQPAALSKPFERGEG